MILGITIAIAFPVGAWAVSGSNVFVTDNVSGKTAAVNSSRQLSVTGPVTANYPTASIVRTNPGGADYVIPDTCPSSQCKTLIKPPTGKALVVTTITADNISVTSPGSDFAVWRDSNGTCNLSSFVKWIQIVTQTVGVQQFQYTAPGGLTVPAGKALCVRDESGGANLSSVQAVGYTVASTAVSSAFSDTSRGSGTVPKSH